VLFNRRGREIHHEVLFWLAIAQRASVATQSQTKAASLLLLAQGLTIELPRLNRGDRGVRSPLYRL
jgi:hypothetical protein